MSRSPTPIFSPREATILDLPIPENAELLHPESIMVRVLGRVHDIGSYCYAVRSRKMRKPNSPCDVVLDSLLRERIPQVSALIRALSRLLTDSGLRKRTVDARCESLKDFMAWADNEGHQNCLAGGDSTRVAYRGYAQDVENRYRRHEFGSVSGSNKQKFVRTALEALTGLDDLDKGVRMIRSDIKESRATEPANQHDFAYVLALNEALFRSLSDLVLGFKPFPYKLPLPESLGWQENHLWLFPASQWCRHPDGDETLSGRYYGYDYQKGGLASEDEIWTYYSGKTERIKRFWARRQLEKSKANLDLANSDYRAYHRLMLASIAQTAFFFLFLANTGGNLQTVIDIETDGQIGEITVNQGYRSIKWRAGGKEVDLVVPVAFMPSLRRYLELRTYLLDGKNCPYLFSNRGKNYTATPSKLVPTALESMYRLLRRIDPALPIIRPKKIRATVSDYYHRRHDAAVTSAVLQNTEATSLKNYNAGSMIDHQVELSLLLQKIATKAQTEVIRPMDLQADHRSLEDGGVCPSYGQPEPLYADAQFAPNCRAGCLFCAKRVLIAGEADTRKVASAAFLMERLIMGPASEAEYRPQIDKCDEDLAKLRAFDGCAEMVDRVKADVFENGNLTPYYADKYQLFLTLGVL